MSETLTLDGLREMALMIQRLAPEPTMRLVESPYLTEDIGHWIEPIRIARQPRSRRLWKKLCQRRRRTSRLMTIPMRDALRLPDGSLVMHTARAAMLAAGVGGAVREAPCAVGQRSDVRRRADPVIEW